MMIEDMRRDVMDRQSSDLNLMTMIDDELLEGWESNCGEASE
jgi:hypothetical protein